MFLAWLCVKCYCLKTPLSQIETKEKKATLHLSIYENFFEKLRVSVFNSYLIEKRIRENQMYGYNWSVDASLFKSLELG